MQIYIFISYGHDEYKERTRLLFEQLNKDKENFAVWWDEGIEASDDWIKKIEVHLNDLIIKKPASCFIYVITPHSANTKRDNFCIKEIAKALDGSVRIIPIKVVDTPIPLLLSNIQWLDFTNCHFDDSNQEFLRRINSLRKIIMGTEELPNDGKQMALHSWLEPCNFTFELGIHLKDYEPRIWLLNSVKDWMKQDDSKILLLLGGPGTGKTAFSLWLSYGELSHYIAAWHLCQYNDKRTCSQRNAVKSLAYYLSTRITDYYNGLDLAKVDKDLNNADYDAGTLFKALILEPLNRINSHEGKLAILIDALDEASQNGYNDLAEMLSLYANQLPKWIKFIITSRDDRTVTTHLSECSTIINLDEAKSTMQSQQDVLRYVNRVILSEEKDPSIAAYVARESGNNFLYAQLMCNTIHDNPQFVSGDLPKGINSYYSLYIKRYFNNNKYGFDFRTHAQPLLNIILTAYEPLNKEDDIYKRLHATCHWCTNHAVYNDLIACFGPLLKVTSGNLVPFHKSLSDWFLDSSKSHEYSVYRADGLEEMIKWGRDLLEDEFVPPKDKMVNHFYRYLPQYMIEASDPSFATFYTNLEFWKQRQKVLGIDLMLRLMIDELSTCPEDLRNRIFGSERFFNILDAFSADLFNKGFYGNLRNLGYTMKLASGMDDNHRLVAVRYYYITESYDEIEKNLYIFEQPYQDQIKEAMVLNELGQSFRKLGKMEKAGQLYLQSIEKALNAHSTYDEVIYSKLNLSRVYTLLCRHDDATRVLHEASDEFDRGLWQGSLQGSDEEFSLRQLERAVRYVILETENFSLNPNKDLCIRELAWADNLYSDPLKRDRYYPNHLISKILFKIRTHNLDNMEELVKECKQSVTTKFDNIRLAYLLSLLQLTEKNQDEALAIAIEQFEYLLTLPYHMIERTEFAALIHTISGTDYTSHLPEEMLPWYQHTLEVIAQITE